ncbi:hypothetical protein [Caulobacter sp. DWP3-1-3b2]|uniref:hypothetical protein n=1 Tax=Caulobacter sp. DWP3-1-3b2 TaxID=2804643 RepID=UPI003CEDE693
MMGCPNCSGVLWTRERGFRRDALFCLTCGFTCEAPGTGITLATAASAFILGALGLDFSNPTNVDLRQA